MIKITDKREFTPTVACGYCGYFMAKHLYHNGSNLYMATYDGIVKVSDPCKTWEWFNQTTRTTMTPAELGFSEVTPVEIEITIVR